ncbi:MAG: hypothetical protein R3B47_07135 [Bacteroidia bacterium]
MKVWFLGDKNIVDSYIFREQTIEGMKKIFWQFSLNIKVHMQLGSVNAGIGAARSRT